MQCFSHDSTCYGEIYDDPHSDSYNKIHDVFHTQYQHEMQIAPSRLEHTCKYVYMNQHLPAIVLDWSKATPALLESDRVH